jgi:hypothetical protein
MSFDIAKYPTLALVDSTQELRLLPKESLPKLCDELRRYLLDSVSRSSGHFASGLGTVELTVALHCRHLFETRTTHCICTFVNFTQRTVNNVYRHGRLLAFQRVCNTRHQCFG